MPGPGYSSLTRPSYEEKAGYYSAVRLETGEVEWMEVEGNSNSGNSVAFRESVQERVGRFLGWIDPPERGGETALPDGAPVAGQGASGRLPT